MLCPLRKRKVFLNYNDEEVNFGDHAVELEEFEPCRQEKCAWYRTYKSQAGECSLLSMTTIGDWAANHT